MSAMGGKGSPLGVGMVVVSSFENAERNCALHMSAFSRLVAPTRPPDFRVPTPKLSCLSDFMKV